MIETQAKRRKRIILTLIFIFIGYFLPILFLRGEANSYAFAIVITVGIFAIAASGLNILVGYCGLLNLGFAGFLCIGGYTAAILMKDYNANFWVALIAAVAHSALWGVILGIPMLGLSGDYFAIATFGFSELVVLVAKNWQSMTGGTRGYPGVPRPTVGISFIQKLGFFKDVPPEKLIYTFTVNGKAAYWVLVFSFLVITLLLMRRLIHSRLGRAWIALREDDLAANACGINDRKYKTIAFAVSAGLGGLAGALQAAYLANVDWHSFTFMTSVFILCYVVLGGMGTLTGPLFGAIVLVSLSEILRTQLEANKINPDFRFIIYGLILIIMIRFRPEGIIPSWHGKRAKPGAGDDEKTTSKPPEIETETAKQ